MRKATLATIFSVFLFILSLVLSAPTWAQPSHIPHEDPNNAEEAFKPYVLLSNYSIFLEFVIQGRFDDTGSMLELLRTFDVPPEIQNAIDVYHTATQEVSASLDNISALLVEVDDLIDDGLLAEAESILLEVEAFLSQIDIQLNDMRDGLEDLLGQMGKFIADSALFAGAFDLHDQIVERLQETKDQYHELYQQLIEVSQSVGLPTTLTISLSSDVAFVGQQITLQGKLTYTDGADNIIALPGRGIALRLGASLIVKVLTDGTGDYSGALNVPYNYIDSLIAKASFEPTTVFDRANYKSDYVESDVSVEFFHTDLQLANTPARLLKGYPFMVNGVVIGDDVQVSERVIRLYLNKELLGTGLSETGGSFEVEGIVPADVPLGNYRLEVEVLADDNSQSSGSSQSVNVDVSQEIPDITLNFPRYAFASSSARFQGDVSYKGSPVTDAVVSVIIADSEYATATDSDGHYLIEVELPLSLALISDKTVSVVLQPKERWLRSIEVERDFTVMSVISIGFFSLAVIASGFVVFDLRKKRRRNLLRERKVPSDDADLVSQRKFKAERKGILAVYDEASTMIQELTGIIAGMNMTLRDYLDKLAPELGKMKSIFANITKLAEIELYSLNSGSEDAKEANRLLSELKRELISE